MKTKHKTTTKDIIRLLALADAAKADAGQRRGLNAAIDATTGQLHALEKAIAANAARTAAMEDVKRIPAPRRTIAANIIATAERIAQAVAELGGDYSGNTRHLVVWGQFATASTATGSGEQYSRSCTYKKTDADHIVTLDPAGVTLLVEDQTLRAASARDGLHLIALYPDGRATWVKTKGKAIISENGWIVGGAAVCYHSTASLEHAKQGLARKLAAMEKEARARRLTQREERRAALVARLCNGVSATLADALKLGYCVPGIRAFQGKHCIGDEATLPQLIRTGEPSAVRLALTIARNVKRATAAA